MKHSEPPSPALKALKAFIKLAISLDTGIGFCNADPTRAFEPFARLHGSQYPGHGIGLSFVKQVVQRHGGSVWARPRLPHGATMAFTLPSLG